MLVAELLQSQGWYIVPSYDYAGEDGNKAPRLQGAQYGHVIPDLDVSRDGQRLWVEVKTKSQATFHRKSQRWEHGIPKRHWDAYMDVRRITGTDVWVFVVDTAQGDVLFNDIETLGKHARIYSGGKMSRGGMVFFPVTAFRSWFQAFGEGAA